jgi:D-alanyl-D-alanine carboxypeptidase
VGLLALPALVAVALGSPGSDRAAAERTVDFAPSTTVTPRPAPSPPDDPPPLSTDPLDPTVLIDRAHPLPPGWAPPDLVVQDVAFNFSGRAEKRQLRLEAADALRSLFAAARADGFPLLGVSGYRSEARQRDLYGQYQHRDGRAAERYSAPPGTSEHQTGLAIDVTGADGRCAASDCFATRAEAMWLAGHAHEHGWIVRYPEGKQLVTGYQYEPWHLRYVGTDLATRLAAAGLTLEEYAFAHPATG